MTKTVCKRLQTPGGDWIQDSRFQRSAWIQGAGFKIQDFEELLESRGQDSRFKIQGFKKVLESRGLDSRFKILKNFLNPGGRTQDSRFKILKNFLNPAPLDSRFKILKNFLNPSLAVWVWSPAPWIQEVLQNFESWIPSAPRRLQTFANGFCRWFSLSTISS